MSELGVQGREVWIGRGRRGGKKKVLFWLEREKKRVGREDE